jgi:hypothetical protein
MKAFVDMLHTGGPAPIPIEESLASTLATIAIIQSLSSGAAVPVNLALLNSDTESSADDHDLTD